MLNGRPPDLHSVDTSTVDRRDELSLNNSTETIGLLLNATPTYRNEQTSEYAKDHSNFESEAIKII